MNQPRSGRSLRIGCGVAATNAATRSSGKHYGFSLHPGESAAAVASATPSGLLPLLVLLIPSVLLRPSPPPLVPSLASKLARRLNNVLRKAALILPGVGVAAAGTSPPKAVAPVESAPLSFLFPALPAAAVVVVLMDFPRDAVVMVMEFPREDVAIGDGGLVMTLEDPVRLVPSPLPPPPFREVLRLAVRLTTSE